MRHLVLLVAFLATVLTGCTALTGFGDLEFDRVDSPWPEAGPRRDAGDAGTDDRDADLDAVVPPPVPDADAQAPLRDTGSDDDAADGTVLPVDADGPDADSATTDGSGPEDTGPVDPDTGPIDSGPIDAGDEPDAWSDPDTGPVDSGPPPVDAWVDPDTGPADTGPEPDAFTDPDTGPPDTGPVDSGPPACPGTMGCCDGTIDQIYLDPFLVNGMVGCRGTETQCTAETLCAPSWHLCTPQEFADRGGQSVIPIFQVWIAGCARHADCSTITPVPMSGGWIWEVEPNICDGTCAERIGGTALPADREWGFTCMAPIVTLRDLDCALGVVGTGPRQYTIGSSGPCAYNQVQSAFGREGAACCH